VTNPNLAPTLHSLVYITLPEYCRVGGFDEAVVRVALGNSDVTWGGGMGTDTFIRARTLAHVCNKYAPMKVPSHLDPDLFVFLG
jgi:hypothetical protein